MRYSYRKYTPEGNKAFEEWVRDHDWSEVSGDPSEMASALGKTLNKAMEAFFPLITRRLRSDQDPWINTALEKMIVRRKRIFSIQGRSKSWKKVKKKTEAIIRERKQGYLNYQVEKAKEKGGLGNRFAALTKPFMSVDTAPNFDVKTLCRDGASDLECAEECANYFSAISNEFVPLDMDNIPSTYSLTLLKPTREEIMGRLRSFKKPSPVTFFPSSLPTTPHPCLSRWRRFTLKFSPLTTGRWCGGMNMSP